jgi:ABC-type transport system involved in multi-copper enzyme maturation permease subunit
MLSIIKMDFLSMKRQYFIFLGLTLLALVLKNLLQIKIPFSNELKLIPFFASASFVNLFRFEKEMEHEKIIYSLGVSRKMVVFTRFVEAVSITLFFSFLASMLTYNSLDLSKIFTTWIAIASPLLCFNVSLLTTYYVTNMFHQGTIMLNVACVVLGSRLIKRIGFMTLIPGYNMMSIILLLTIFITVGVIISQKFICKHVY